MVLREMKNQVINFIKFYSNGAKNVSNSVKNSYNHLNKKYIIVLIIGLMIFSSLTGFSNLVNGSNVPNTTSNNPLNDNNLSKTSNLISHSFTSLSSQIKEYYPLYINNTQSIATPSPYQQLINLTTSSFTPYLNYNGSIANFEFIFTNNTTIPSWIESNVSGVIKVWLKLPQINASSSLEIYLGFGSSTTNFLSSSGTSGIGEAPQLSFTYGKYDDGSNIFTQYGGKSWNSFTYYGGNWITTNGYLQQTDTTGSYNNGATALITNTNYSVTGKYILGMAFNYTTNVKARVGIVAIATPTTVPSITAYRFINSESSNFISFLNDQVAWVVQDNYQGALNTNYTMIIRDSNGTWDVNLFSGYSEFGTTLTVLNSTFYTTANLMGKTSGYIGISATFYNGTTFINSPINVQWFYMRSYSPNGIMPSQSFGLKVNNTVTGNTISLVNVGLNPNAIAISSNNVYVINYDSANVSIIGLTNNTNWKQVSVGTEPDSIVLSSNNAYISNYGSSDISIIGLINNTNWKTITVGTQPNAIILSSNNAYVLNYGSANVSLIGLTNNTNWKQVSVESEPRTAVISSNNIYVVNYNSNDISIIGLTNNTNWKTITVGSSPYGISLSSNNIYIANYYSHNISLIGLTNNTNWKQISVGTNPNSISISSNNAYVLNYGSANVSLIGFDKLIIETL